MYNKENSQEKLFDYCKVLRLQKTISHEVSTGAEEYVLK